MLQKENIHTFPYSIRNVKAGHGEPGEGSLRPEWELSTSTPLKKSTFHIWNVGKRIKQLARLMSEALGVGPAISYQY